jgi:hypothetical protein
MAEDFFNDVLWWLPGVARIRMVIVMLITYIIRRY